MKTKYWIAIISLVLIVCTGLSLWLLRPDQSASTVQILSEGKLLHTLSLKEDQQITVTTDRGSNTITIKDGKVAVTDASCPDSYCMARGWCSGGAQIVCLPNRLVIEFTDSDTLDGISG